MAYNFTSFLDPSENKAIIVFPNPFINLLNVNLNDGSESYDVEILNLNGYTVFSGMTKPNMPFEVQENLPSGLYLLKIIGENEVKIHKIIKE
jgi:hypothetical protein